MFKNELRSKWAKSKSYMDKKTKIIWIFILLFLFPTLYMNASDNSDAFGFDFSVGGIIMPIDYYASNTNDFAEFKVEPYYTFSAGITYNIIDWFAVGGWFGYFHNSPYIEAAISDGVLPLSIPFTYGIRLIFGNMEKFAFSANLGVTPSLGLFINNIIINAFWGGATTIMIRTYDENNVLIGGAEKTFILPYIEIGYHWNIKGKS